MLLNVLRSATDRKGKMVNGSFSAGHSQLFNIPKPGCKATAALYLHHSLVYQSNYASRSIPSDIT